LKAAHAADPPFSPSSRGGSDRYIVRGVLDAVRQATGLNWANRDMTKHVESLIREMRGAGWLRVEKVKVGRNTRQGLVVDPARTPWAHEFTGKVDLTQPLTQHPHQMHQMPIEAIDANEAGGIDAPRPEGASNVPKGCGGLTQEGFDTNRTGFDPAVPPAAELAPVVPADAVVVPEPAVPELPSSIPEGRMPSSPAAVSGPSDNADNLDIPPFLDRRRWAQRKSGVDGALLRDSQDP
jgi:hypothetical protein